ncbi:MAG: hypothetical protein ABWY51_07555 [Gaiellaceae bacterium]|jgi:hypothetical protein
MDVVRFAFGDRPEIDDLDANDLAGNLSLRRNLAATEVVGKIAAELQKPLEERSDIRLTRVELNQLIIVLTEDLPTMPKRRHDLEHLLPEAQAAQARGEWAPGT